MKKTIKTIIILASCCLCAVGCGFDDVKPEYPTKSMLFTYQFYNRELVVGEGLKFKLGVVFAGMSENDRDRYATYEIDPSLVPDGYTLMPSEYYTCSDPSRIKVPKGDFKGYMPVQIDSAAFLADPLATTGKYVIPFKLVEADADQITPGKEYMVMSLKYLAKQFGYYQYSGKRTDVATSEEYSYSYRSSEKTSVRQLVTAGPTTLRVKCDPYGEADPAKTDKYSMLLTLPTRGGGAVTLEADPDSKVVVEPNGECSYDESSKTFTLNYKYSAGGKSYTVSETMTFRNRIRDDQGNGVHIDEWEGF